MFSPLDILYIVLAFCVLWLTAAIFWLLWQVATMMRSVNDAIAEGREVMNKVEATLAGIHHKFDSASSSMNIVVQLAAKGMEYLMDKKLQKKPAKKR